MVIKLLKAREILDSRGNPTVEVFLETDNSIFISSVPSGASVGRYEAIELRDGGSRYRGKGVLKAVNNINEIITPALKGKDLSQREADGLMIDLDGTENKGRLGANAILAVSMAICKATAGAKDLPLYQYISQLSETKPVLPIPSFNVINGGVHAENNLDFQEFMILPSGNSFTERLEKATDFYYSLKKLLAGRYQMATNVGDEGGFAPPLNRAEEALDLMLEVEKIDIALDVAAGKFLKDGRYGSFSKKELTDYYLKLIEKYPIISIEDPFDEDDFDGWKELMSKVETPFSIIGDDLLSTNIKRIELAKKENLCNGMILKLNQIGTVTEGIMAAKKAKEFGWKIMVSHRSGETTDDFIADFAVGIGTDYIKSGAPARGERVTKYNRLLKIEQEILK